jgi:hypothetical protein
MISNGTETDSGGDIACPAKGTQERGFTHTEPPPVFEDVARTIMLGKIKRVIWIIPYVVPHGIIEFYRPIDWIFARTPYYIICILDNFFMATVDD